MNSSTTFVILSLITNTLLLFIILYELTYCGSLATLSPSRFYRIQLVKSIYFLGLVIIAAISGSGFIEDVKERGSVWRGVVVV